MFPFYTPLKTPEKQKYSSVFRRYKMGAVTGDRVIFSELLVYFDWLLQFAQVFKFAQFLTVWSGYYL